MKRVLKWVGIAAAVLVGLLVLGLGGAYAASVSKEGRVYATRSDTFEIPTDPERVAEGERLFVSRGCGDCHGADGGGRTFIDDAPARLSGSNLTRVAAGFGASDWSRAVRYGLRSDGTALVFMPSHEYYAMPDGDLAAIAAHVRTLPPVERELPPNEVRMLGRVVDLAGGFHLFPASVIDHEGARPFVPEPAPTAEYGAYLAVACTGCHGAQLSGGPIPGAPPELGLPLNLTMHESGLAAWSGEDFRRSMREGVTPDGRQLNGEQMPWPNLSRMNDVEIDAIWAYLQTVPQVAEGNR
jgi:mono/diheme cytochrome c family protein